MIVRVFICIILSLSSFMVLANTERQTEPRKLTVRHAMDTEKQIAITAAKRQQEGRILQMQRYGERYRFKMMSKDGRVTIVEIDRKQLKSTQTPHPSNKKKDP